MVKLGRGGMGNVRGRQKPRPLFPPGELPLFGPPPAYIRRPPGPPMPLARGPMGYGPPPPLRPPHLGPPMPPPSHMNLRRRPGPGPPPPPMPLLQAPVIPPRPMPFMRGRPLPRLGPPKKLAKNMKKGKNKKNKNRVITTKPEGEFYCEICDRSWETTEELETHISEHVSCHVEGCIFNAAPKVVALHVKLQHESGVFDRIVQSYDSEEIEKWKAERRRNYPTAENIERKTALKNEMDQRGERVHERNGSFKHKEGFELKKERMFDGPKAKRRRKRRNPNASDKPQFLSTVSISEDLIQIPSTDVPEDAENNFSDEEWLRDDGGNKQESAPLSKILMDLSASYASGSEDEDPNVNTDKQERTSSNPVQSEDEAPTEEKISRESDNLPNIHLDKTKKIDAGCKQTPLKLNKKHNVSDKVTNEGWKPNIRKRPLTLLEKLLSKEIRQERNHILQCIRYIIQENYFEDQKMTT